MAKAKTTTTTNTHKLFDSSLKLLAFGFVILTGTILITIISYFLLINRFYPGIYLANTHLFALTPTLAEQKIQQKISPHLNTPLTLDFTNTQNQTQNYTLNLSSLKTSLDYQEKLNQSFSYGHSKFYYKPQSLNLNLTLTPDLISQLENINKSIEQPPIDSQLKIDQDGQITVTPSHNGSSLDITLLTQTLEDYINTGTLSTQILPTKISYPKLSYSAALQIKNSLDQLKLSPLRLTFNPPPPDYPRSWTLTQEKVLDFIDLQNTQPSLLSTEIFETPLTIKSVQVGSKQFQDSTIVLDQQKLSTYLKTIAQTIDQEVEEPLFSVDPDSPEGKIRISEFRPPQQGRKLNIEKSSRQIAQAIFGENKKELALPVEVVNPKNKLANELGIKELIGRGVSNFSGSIENRIYNIRHTVQKINGLLIAPGETFSFVGTVGDISAATGFKPAYVIKSGRTILDDGGGVCQVSTTVFRAALNAGVPIPKRTAHAYRVSYYEQGFSPGLDATIFHPSVDLQFKNDTPSHILIQSYVYGTSMYVDLYGTSDGRISSLTKPTVTNFSPAPTELRQDDPTLPRGTIKQVDFAASGATVKFSRTVKRNGETLINETYTSNYRPWQAVFLVGTKD